MKVDVLAIGVHPDDVELSAAGTVLSLVNQGRRVAIVDLTEGELGTRGTPELRLEEAQSAADILGVKSRLNLDFRDGFFRNDEEHQLKLIAAIRHFQPEVVLSNAVHDRHPDHGRAAELSYDAVFLSGLAKIETVWRGEQQAPWRPRLLLNYIQDRSLKPDIVVDISDHFEKKMQAIQAFRSQFYDENSEEPATYISSPQFLDGIKARAMEMGRPSGFKYAEGFTSSKGLGVKDLMAIF